MSKDDGNVIPFPQQASSNDPDCFVPAGVDMDVYFNGEQVPDFAEWANAQFFSTMKVGQIQELMEELREEISKNPEMGDYIIAHLTRLLKHIQK